MIPTWMIRELERRRQRQERRERLDLPIEAPRESERDRTPRRPRSGEPVVIDL